MAHADDLQAVSVDEALIDVTSTVSRLRAIAAKAHSLHDPAKDFAEVIRTKVREATACEGMTSSSMYQLDLTRERTVRTS